MRAMISTIWKTTIGRYFLLTAAVGAVIMGILLLTGKLTVSEIVNLQRKLVEFCPFCM